MSFLRENKDSFLLLVFGVNYLLYVTFIYQYENLSWPSILSLGSALVFLICTNYQCIAHNFIHNPFFQSEKLNLLFSLLNSPLLGMPQCFYKLHHLNHHKYNNDKKDPSTGTTKDKTSLYRYSNNADLPEGILSYAFIGTLRTDIVELYHLSSRHPFVLRHLEIAFCFMPFIACYFLGGFPRAAAYMTVWYLGQVLAYAENYLEHYGATPGNRKTDSVSCYNPIYNFLWFNNGYHQEHHFKPTVHWSKIRSVRELLPPSPGSSENNNDEVSRRVVPIAHFYNIFLSVEVANKKTNDGKCKAQ